MPKGRNARRPPALNSRAILETLSRHRVRFVLIGGLAAVAHGSPLATFDADITPDPERGNLGRLASALSELEAKLRGPGFESIEVPLDDRTFDRLTTATFRTKHGNLDVVIRPDAPKRRSFTYRDLKAGAVAQTVFGVRVYIASLDHIIASKEASGRDRDLAALPVLYELRDQLNE